MRAPTKAFAQRVAYEWHGGMSSPLYSFASTGGTVWSEDHRRNLIREVEKDIAWAEQYNADREARPESCRGRDDYGQGPHRLRRLLEYVQGAMSREEADLLQHFIATENPEQCRHCGTRTDFEERYKFQHHTCPNCGFEYILEE